MTVKLDSKTKQDLMIHLESKVLINNNTNLQETTLAGANYQSANIIENETSNMV